MSESIESIKPRLVDLVRAEDAELLSLIRDIAETGEGTEERSEAEQALQTYSGSLQLRAKVDSYGRIMSFLEAQETMVLKEIEHLKTRVEFWKRQQKRLENHAIFALTMTEPDRNGRQRLEGSTTTLMLRDNPPKVDVENDDWHNVPEEFVKVTVTIPLVTWRKIEQTVIVGAVKYDIMRDKIREAIKKHGATVPGASLSQSMRVQRT